MVPARRLAPAMAALAALAMVATAFATTWSGGAGVAASVQHAEQATHDRIVAVLPVKARTTSDDHAASLAAWAALATGAALAFAARGIHLLPIVRSAGARRPQLRTGRLDRGPPGAARIR